MTNLALSFSGALKTTDLIGRQEQLAAIRAQIDAPGLGEAFRCVLITADGGKGKTRLLQEVERSFNRPDQSRPVVVLPLVDLADPTLHSVVTFLRVIADALRDSHAAPDPSLLAVFHQAVRAYERDSARGAALRAQEAVIIAFEQLYKQLTGRYRVVWVLDTMEQLYTTPPEIEDLFRFDLPVNLNTVGQTTYGWILKFILSHWRFTNTTMLLAGRPHPDRWVAGIEHSFRQSDLSGLPPEDDSLAAPAGSPPIIKLAVDDFSAPETFAYLAALEAQLRALPDLKDKADFLRDLHQEAEARQLLYRLTQGNPIRLALYIDLLASGSVFPAPFQYSLEELEAYERAHPDGLESLRSAVDGDLLSYLARQLGGTPSQALDYLSIMRRGLDAARLARIWGGSPGWEQRLAAAEQTLAQLGRLSFVKSRPDGRYFLHDELYQIYQMEFLRGDQKYGTTRRAYQQAIYHKVIQICEDELAALNTRILTLQLGPGLDDAQTEELRDCRRQRRQLQAERLHYALYLEPARAFYEVYFALAEQAFATGDLELDGLLQSEVGIFFFGGRADLNRSQTGVEEPAWEQLRFAVLHERVSSASKRLIRASHFPPAQGLAEAARRDHRFYVHKHYAQPANAALLALYEQPAGQVIHQVFAREWMACAKFAGIYCSGEEAQRSVEDLPGIIGELETLLRGRPLGELPAAALDLLPPLFRSRMRTILAQCMMFAGYGNVTLNRFAPAMAFYRKADYLLVHTRPRLDVLLAEVKNNFSRVLGELSRFEDALNLCDEGAQLNEQLGLDQRLAVAYNTKALIHIANQRPIFGARFARRALELFKRIEDQRGVGLALIQIGEGLRRGWWIEVEQRRSRYHKGDSNDQALKEAEQLLGEAVEIFSVAIPEPVRQIEALSALACLHRDKANYQGQGPEGRDFARAVDLFEQALAVAHEKEFSRQELAILADYAWLYKRAGLYDDAERLAARGQALADPRVQLQAGQALDLRAALGDIVVVRELSKLSALRADIAEQRDHDLAETVRQRILAIVYLQIFAPTDAYLGQNKRKLATLLNRERLRDPAIGATIKAQVDQIVHDYGLAALEAELGTLEFRAVLDNLFTPPADMDYVDM